MFFNYQHLIVLTFVRSRRFKVSHLEQYARSVAAELGRLERRFGSPG